MWSRKELKEKAKQKIKKNYGACVAVCFLIAILAGGYSTSTSAINSYDETKEQTENVVTTIRKENNLKAVTGLFQMDDVDHNVETVVNHATQHYNYIFRFMDSITTFKVNKELVTSILLLIATMGSLMILILFQNALLVGESNFFIKNSKSNNTQIREILGMFQATNYVSTIIVMAKKYIYLFLWTFTIIGLPIKLYEYRMIPYIQVMNPNLTSKEKFLLSKKMMNGNKWNTFVLDLSFLGWQLLSALTFGIVGFLYVNPYMKATDTELFLALSTEYKELNA